jgi:hypothetical protein
MKKKDKTEKYFERAKRLSENGNYSEAFSSLKLIKSKEPIYEVYRILAKIYNGATQAYNKYISLISSEADPVYKIVAGQCIYHLILILKNSKSDIRETYESIMKIEPKLKAKLDKNIQENFEEVNEFLRKNKGCFEEIFRSSIINNDANKVVLDKIIKLLKRSETPSTEQVEELYPLYLSDSLLKCIRSYSLLDYSSFKENYPNIKNDVKLICKTLSGVILNQELELEKARIVLKEVLDSESEENILAWKYYTETLFLLKDYKELVLEESRIPEGTKGCLYAAKAYLAIELEDSTNALVFLEEALKVRQDFNLKFLKCKLLIKKDFKKGIKYLKQVAINFRKVSTESEELNNYSHSLIRKMSLFDSNFNRKNSSEIIQLCNVILVLDKKDEDIKCLKKSIIAGFKHKKPENGKLQLEEIITEVRITEDTHYIKYLAKKKVKMKDWESALYLIESALAYEPNNPEMLNLKSKALDKTKKYLKSDMRFKEIPKGEIIICDGNVWIAKMEKPLSTEKGRISFHSDHYSEKVFERLANYNEMVMTTLIKTEIENFLSYELSRLGKPIKSGRGMPWSIKISNQITKLSKEMIKKYSYSELIKYKSSDLVKIKKFYHDRLIALEKITIQKICGCSPNEKLRRLVKREGYLPEINDRKILADAIALSKEKNKQVSILTNDSDFIDFTEDLFNKFKIKIYDVKEMSLLLR